jgi:hypothetical protein
MRARLAVAVDQRAGEGGEQLDRLGRVRVERDDRALERLLACDARHGHRLAQAHEERADVGLVRPLGADLAQLERAAQELQRLVALVLHAHARRASRLALVQVEHRAAHDFPLHSWPMPNG